jgi:DNA-directed RNA polymerase II subunit RPB2
MSKITQEDINKVEELYFKQPKILYQHLFGSMHQLVEEIIPYILSNDINYFYENVDKHEIYMHGFRIDNIRLKPVTYENENELLFPSDARKNYLNYFGTVYADVTQIMRKEDILSGETTIKEIDETEKNVAIAKIPIMLKSKYCTTHIKKDLHGECKYDPGGIVLVNGQEKVIISIEVMVHNKVLIFTKRDNSYKDGKIHVAQINSKKNDWSDNLQILTIRNKKNGVFNFTSSQIADVPIFILFKALGLESDRDIISNITYDLDDTKMLNLLRPSIVFSVDDFENPIRTREEAIDFLITKLRRNKRISVTDEELAVKQKKVYLQKVFRKNLLPHLGDDIPKKIRFLGLMMNRLLNVMLKRESVDDRDACQNKRVETPGVLVSQLFRQNWKKLLNEIGKNFRKKNLSDDKPINVISQIKSNIIEQGIKTALATGMWGMNKTKKGVAQSLQRLSWIQSISYLRRVMTPAPSDASAGIISIRHINNVSMYFLCPTETPEGAKIGIVKSLAMMSTISLQNDSQFDIVIRELNKLNKHVHPYEVDTLEMKSYSKIYMNGNWIGCTRHIVDIFESLKKSRRSGIIDKMTSISCDFEKKIIKIYSDGGRLIRPLLNVENNELVLDKKIVGEIDKILIDNDSGKGWKKILSKYPSLIDYEDIESTGYVMVSPGINKLYDNIEKMNNKIEYKDNSNLNRYGDYRYLKYTHCEFHPWLMLGTVACTIPFSNHNYGTKNIVNFSQVKQSIGIYLTSHLDRMDISQLLYHPQLPVVTTKGTIYNRNNDLPAGENAIVAIMSYTGYNQEDSLIFNQSSIDRGIFRADTLKKYHAQIEKNPSTSQDDIFLKPDRNKVTGMKQGNYDKLNEKGFIPEETEINNGDIIIGKVSPIQPTGNNNKVYKDNSEIFKSNVTGVIDRVHTGVYNSDGYEMYNVRVRMERKPIIGDKFSSRHGQKGTLGIALQQKDMPFTESGMIPDLILNPHAIPSRMTISQLIECVASKVGAIEGKFVDGTPFNNYNVREIPDILEKLGYNRFGTETMYCGMTGKKMKAQIFIGPTYYVRLKHMVLDKVHSRSQGPRQALTRQPLEGRARDGGLKIGEMEKDAMVAHGCGQFLKERMMECSDITKVYVCDECGLFATKAIDKDYYVCRSCNNSTRISAVTMPYACKLLYQELMSVNVLPRIRTEQSIYGDNI